MNKIIGITFILIGIIIFVMSRKKPTVQPFEAPDHGTPDPVNPKATDLLAIQVNFPGYPQVNIPPALVKPVYMDNEATQAGSGFRMQRSVVS